MLLETKLTHISWEIAPQSIFKGKGIFTFLFSKFLYLAMMGRKSNISFWLQQMQAPETSHALATI